MKSYVVRDSSGKEFSVDENKISDAEKDGFLPVVSNGQDTHRVSFKDMGLATKDGFAPIMPQVEKSIGERVVRGALSTLPAVGGTVAGLMATPESFGVATIPAAAAGAMAGKSLKDTIEKYLYNEGPKSYAEQVKGLGTEGAMMAGGEGAAKLISEVPGLAKNGGTAVARYIGKKLGPKIAESIEYTPIPNQDQVLKAADQLGISLPKGVLTDNPTYQKLESGLAQSGSFPAAEVKTQYNNMGKGLQDAADKIAALKTTDSDFALGKKIQSDLTDQVAAKQVPVKELYGKIVPDLQKIPVDEGVVNKVFGQLKKDPLFQTQDGIKFLEEHKNIISQTPELNSLKEVRSGLNDLVNEQSLPVEQKRVQALRNAATKIRDNSIEALKANLPAHAHPEIDDLINEITLADKAHASNIQDINSVKSIAGNKDFGSPSNFVNKLGNLKEADIAQKAGNLDVTTLQNLQNKFPTVFEKAKAAKINDLIQSSTNPASGFNENSFIKKYDNLDKEMKDLIFTPEMQSHIESFKTLKQAIPAKLGPSGTPEGLLTMDMFSPKRNALDFGIKKTLESVGPKPVTLPPPSAPSKATTLLQVLQGGGESTPPTNMLRAAKNDKTEPQKGESKWANDGIKNLKAHDTSNQIPPEVYKQLLKTPQGQQLLIKASDLKPGTKAMDEIVKKIKTTASMGD